MFLHHLFGHVCIYVYIFHNLTCQACCLSVWSKVRDDKNKDVDWILVGYDGNSKTDMTVVDSGSGGLEAVSSKLPEGEPIFGGVRLSTGRFVHFLYIDESCNAMKRGRTLMYKNGK